MNEEDWLHSIQRKYANLWDDMRTINDWKQTTCQNWERMFQDIRKEHERILKSELEVPDAVLIPLMKKIVEKHLCPACLDKMEQIDEHTWGCKCTPNARMSVG